MQAQRFREEVTDLVLEMAWSQWAELGVSGWARHHSEAAVDLEALILLTAGLAEHDARLRDESLDWCVLNSRLVSAVRLRNLGPRTYDDPLFGRYAATVKAHTRALWPGEGEVYPFRPTNRSAAPNLSRPALVQLQLRSLAGVSARAEILRVLLADPSSGLSASSLASNVGHGKTNVVSALDGLVMAQIVDAVEVRNQVRYRLSRASELVALLGGIPASFPDWLPIFRVARAFFEFAQTSPEDGIARSAAVSRLLSHLKPDLQTLGLSDGEPRATGEALATEFQAWAIARLRSWAGLDEDPPSAGDPIFTVHRLGDGSWLGMVTFPGGRPEPLELSDWALHYSPEHPRSDAVIADDSFGAPLLGYALLDGARKAVGIETDDFWFSAPDRPSNQLISRAFGEERLWPMRRGQTVTFTAQFLRRWYADHLERLGGRPRTALPG